MGSSIFSGCYSLSSVELSSSISDIGEYAFRDCVSLVSINLPDSLKTIGDNAYRGCTSLTSIDIPNLVNKIGKQAFRDCNSLKTLYIPKSIKTIGVYAFICEEDQPLEDVYVAWDTPLSISKNVFSYDDYFLVQLKSYKVRLHVPAASVSKYKQAPVWKDFYGFIPWATDITSLNDDNNATDAIHYNLNGVIIKSDIPGIHIIKQNDGKTVKRFVK